MPLMTNESGLFVESHFENKEVRCKNRHDIDIDIV